MTPEGSAAEDQRDNIKTPNKIKLLCPFKKETCWCRMNSLNSVFPRKIVLHTAHWIHILCKAGVNGRNMVCMSVEIMERKSIPAALWLNIHHLASCELKPHSFTSSASFPPLTAPCWCAAQKASVCYSTLVHWCRDHCLSFSLKSQSKQGNATWSSTST